MLDTPEIKMEINLFDGPHEIYTNTLSPIPSSKLQDGNTRNSNWHSSKRRQQTDTSHCHNDSLDIDGWAVEKVNS